MIVNGINVAMDHFGYCYKYDKESDRGSNRIWIKYYNKAHVWDQY